MAKPASFKDMQGRRFERLLVLQQGPSDNNGNARWVCQCDCGSKTLSHGFSLRNGAAKSCGCLTTDQLKERITRHGLADRPEYRVWAGMLQRCDNPKTKKFRLYGGRGIKVCERWREFVNFYADMGPRPTSRHSIERRDGNGDYEPSNCYWATPTQQANNTTQNHKVTYRGQTMNLTQAIRLGGTTVNFSVVRARMKRGWSVEAAVETPPDPDVWRNRPKKPAR